MSIRPDSGAIRSGGWRASEPDLLDDPSWFLDRLDFEREIAVFTHTQRETLSSAVFLDHNWDRRGLARRATPLAHLRDYNAESRPPAIIWHTAFCCSTLIASCLDGPGVALALKEPMAMVELSAARRNGRDTADERLAAAVIHRLGLGFSARERCVIKPSNGANGLLPDAAALGGPMVLLYSSCRQFLFSVIGGGPTPDGGEERRRLVRNLMAERVRSQRPPLRFSASDLSALTDLQVAALLWHVQVAEFRAAARAIGPRRARSLDCEGFLADPLRCLLALDGHFELGLGADRLSQVAQGAVMKRYAKQPNRKFDAADRRQAFRSIESEMGPAVDALVAWSYQACPETPPGDPIGSPLLLLHG